MTITLLSSLSISCTTCALCSSASRDLIPFLSAGPHDAKIAIIDSFRGSYIQHRGSISTALRSVPGAIKNESAIEAASFADLLESARGSFIDTLFGQDWYTSGKFIYTNLLRCDVSEDLDNCLRQCGKWTEQVISERKAIIMLGPRPLEYVLGSDASKFSVNEAKRNRGIIYCYLPDISLPSYNLDDSRDLVKVILKEVYG